MASCSKELIELPPRYSFKYSHDGGVNSSTFWYDSSGISYLAYGDRYTIPWEAWWHDGKWVSSSGGNYVLYKTSGILKLKSK